MPRTPTLRLLMALMLLGVLVASPVALAADYARWYAVPLPTPGEAGGWLLAYGETRQIAMASDGALYAVSQTETGHALLRSGDGGSTWEAVTILEDGAASVDLLVAPDGTVYYASTSAAYASRDGGRTFAPLPPDPGGSGTSNIEITSLDVAPADSGNLVAIGTRDRDPGEFGGVFVLDEGNPGAGWWDTGIGSYDVTAVAFSPQHGSDGGMLAVATDEVDGLATARLGPGGWGADITAATLPGIIPQTATIAFPDDYAATRDGAAFFAGLDTGTGAGDVFRIVRQGDGFVATDLEIGAALGQAAVDVSSLAASGEATSLALLAGAASGSKVYASRDGGQAWTASEKAPTGQGVTGLLMAPGFPTSGRAYAMAGGADGAFSQTGNGGRTWRQTSLVDTAIEDLVDLAVSPDCLQGGLFLLTFGDGRHSLWRGTNDGASWERILSSSSAGIDSLAMVTASPQPGAPGFKVFVSGTSSGAPALWESADGGDTFQTAVAPVNIDVWATAVDALHIGGYDGSQAVVYAYPGGSFAPAGGSAVSTQSLHSMAASPGFGQDGTLLLGDRQGRVYLSEDSAATFRQLGEQLPVSGGTGNVGVTFDPEFSVNRVVYASDDTGSSDGGIFRFVLGSSTRWERIDAAGVDRRIAEIAASSGVLYALDTFAGLERKLNPASPMNHSVETVANGLTDGAVLTALNVCGNRVWMLDTHNGLLLAYIDTLSSPVPLAAPEDGQPGVNPLEVVLDWAAMPGATQYQWQIDYDGSFATVPAGLEGTTSASRVRPAPLDAGTRYHWRVRAAQPALGPWSPRRSFTTMLGDPSRPPELLSPKAGEADVSRRPVFQWTSVTGAERYELLVATDMRFENRIITPTHLDRLPTTAWQADTPLEPGSTYYWKVRGRSEDTFSAWSAVGAFITRPRDPQPEETAPLQPEEPAADGADAADGDAETLAGAAPLAEANPEAAAPGGMSRQSDGEAAEGAVPRTASSEGVTETMTTPDVSVEMVIPEWAVNAAIGLLAVIAVLLIALLAVLVRRPWSD